MEATLDRALDVTRPVSIRSRWTGRVLTALPVLFLALDAAMKLAGVQPVVEASARIGLPAHLNGGIGALLLALVVLHVVPRTAVLGAVLLTGYLGGAVVIHLRIGDPLVSHTLFPVYVGTMLWAGLFLRDDRARALLGRAR